MALLDEFRSFDSKKEKDHAKKALFQVVDNIMCRQGFSGIWDEIDDPTKEEILATNLETIESHMREYRDLP